jgi:hypothetical protein
MADQKSPTGNPGVTLGTNRQAQQARVFAGDVAGSQTGNTPGTTGNRDKAFCSRCSRSKPLPGTATGPVVAGCSRCSRCDPGQQQVARGNGPAKTAPLDLAALGAFVRRSQPVTASAEAGGTSNLPAAQWLELLAAVLGCSPGWLLESGRVDADDLAERGRVSDAARLIRSHGWTTPPSPLRSPAPAGDASTTAASPLPWLEARDAYLSHVMACGICRAHLPKSPTHCPAGAELRRHYDHQTTHHITSPLETPHV